jgi:hypothetical protein
VQIDRTIGRTVLSLIGATLWLSVATSARLPAQMLRLN